jgi:predicted RNA-binding Zn-ribbon protein involved in translation (DUF1610 family)
MPTWLRNNRSMHDTARPTKISFVLMRAAGAAIAALLVRYFERQIASTAPSTMPCGACHDGPMTEATTFQCPNCETGYKVVRVEAARTGEHRQLTCLGCGAALLSREGKFALKYFRTEGSRRAKTDCRNY